MPKSVGNYDKPLAIFLSPALGLSAVMVVSFSINRIGLPVKDFGIPLAAISLVFIAFRRHHIFSQLISHFNTLKFLAIPIGILFTGWPILKYGFSWLSYVNDDMNNYVLAATRFLNSGFFSTPSGDFLQGKDYSQLYYNMHVVNHVRSGSEIFLALISSITQLPPIKIFMPSILALQITMIFGTLSMSRLSQRRSKRLTRISYFLSILMSMMSLGFLYQLIAQVGGIAIGIAFICVFVVYLKTRGTAHKNWNLVIVAGCIMSSQLIWYPEFLVFVSLICFGILLRHRSHLRKEDSITAVAFGFLVIFILNKYFFQAILFGFSQISGAQGSISGVNSNAQLFPYFLNPHGLVSYLGLGPLNSWFSKPWESLAVIFAFLILFAVIFYSIRVNHFSSPSTIGFLVLFLVFCYLVATANGFGAFKISMFAAPFLVILFAEIIDSHWKITNIRPKSLLFAMFIIFAVLNVRTAQFYSSASTGTSSNGFNEIQNGSGVDFTNLIRKALMESGSINRETASTSANLSQIKLEAIGAKGFPLFFTTTYPFDNIYDTRKSKGKMGYKEVSYASAWGVNSFIQSNALTRNPDGMRYLIANNKYEAFNHSYFNESKENWTYQVLSKPRNHIAFIDSSMGPSYYRAKNRQEAVIFQPEKNPMVAGKYMQSIGDDFLIQVVGLTSSPVLVMNLTTTVLSQYDRKIPKVYIQGSTIQELEVAGNGSAQMLIPLGKPLVLNGINYYHVHIEQKLAPFLQKRSFISGIYGKKFELDARRISLFMSNLSIVDQVDLNKDFGQSSISQFPESLLGKFLEYSGVYEDGWIGSSSYFVLSDKSSSALEVSGSIPILNGSRNFKTSITLSVDGKRLITKKLGVGPFTVTLPWQSDVRDAGKKRIRIQFSNEQKLPIPDGRPVSAQVSFIGFK